MCADIVLCGYRGMVVYRYIPIYPAARRAEIWLYYVVNHVSASVEAAGCIYLLLVIHYLDPPYPTGIRDGISTGYS